MSDKMEKLIIPLGFEGVELYLAEPKCIYICGPMTGIKDVNYSRFNAAANRMQLLGWEVKNPADNAALNIESGEWVKFIYAGLYQLLQCQAIYLLKDWRQSKGARIEFNLACDLKMELHFEEEAIANGWVDDYLVDWL